MPEDCLGSETVLAFVEGRAGAEERGRVEEHASRCASCRELLSTLARGSQPTAPEGAAPPARPQQIGRYRVTRAVGSGGMGIVYAAHDPELDREVAIKVLRDGSGVAVQERLRREAQAMAKIAHPNVVPVHDVGAIDDRIFLVMEYVEGETLAQYAAGGPSARALVDAYRAAGAGLQAAHAAGIVHRDFKPENVLIGSDGRVRVTDFGLARSADVVPDAPAADAPAVVRVPISSVAPTLPAPVATPVSSDGPTLPAQLTAAGALIGTPYYMAPEQYRGEPATARSDQFSFCLALYRALCGERPFDGADFAHFVPAPGERRLPRRIRTALRRGMAARPEDRFPSMDGVLAALAPPARRAWWLAGAVACVAIAGGVALAMRPAGPAPCTGGSDRLAWDAAHRHAVEAALRAGGGAFADATWREVDRTLGGYVQQWRAMSGEACRATRVRRAQPEAVLELRMVCLDRRAQAFDALVATLSSADPTVAAHAVAAAHALPAIASCADLAALESPVRPPDPAAAQRVAALRGQIAKLVAERDAGLYDRAAAGAHRLERPVQALAYRPLEGELYALIGSAEHLREHDRDARPAYERAALASEAGRDDRGEAETLIALVEVIGDGLGKPTEVGDLRARAEAVLERLDHPPELVASLALAAGAVETKAGQLAAAARDLTSALALAERLYGKDDLHLVHVLRRLAFLEMDREDTEAARGYLDRALAIQQRVLGEAHPDLAGTLKLLGEVEVDGAHYDAGQKLFERARDLIDGSLGADSPSAADIDTELANAALWQGDTKRAIELGRRALAIDIHALGADHPRTLSHQMMLASSLETDGQAKEAAALLTDALARYRKQLGPDHQMIAYALETLANTELDLRRWADARDHAREAIAMYGRLLGDKYNAYAEQRTLGEALVRLGDAGAAAGVLEAARKTVPATEDPGIVARIEADLGEALVDSGHDRARGVALVTRAWHHISTDDRMLGERKALATWLRAHHMTMP